MLCCAVVELCCGRVVRYGVWFVCRVLCRVVLRCFVVCAVVCVLSWCVVCCELLVCCDVLCCFTLCCVLCMLCNGVLHCIVC